MEGFHVKGSAEACREASAAARDARVEAKLGLGSCERIETSTSGSRDGQRALARALLWASVPVLCSNETSSSSRTLFLPNTDARFIQRLAPYLSAGLAAS